MMTHQEDCAEGGTQQPHGPNTPAPAPAMLPVCISDKALLVAEELRLPSPKPPSRLDNLRSRGSGHTTWLLAAIALPTIGVLLLLTLLLVAEPLPNNRRLGMNEYTFWKSSGRWKKSHTPSRNIFILDINSADYPSAQKIATLEACLRTNKHHEIYQITINQYIDQPRNVTAFDQLKKKYNNFHYLFQNAPSYFRGSIFEDNFKDRMLFKAQLLMLWRYTGLVLSPDWICVKPLDKIFAKNDKNVVIGTNNGKLAVLSVFNTCNARLFDVMREVNRLNGTGVSDVDVIDRVALKMKSGFKIVDKPQICNNNTLNGQCVVMRNEPAKPMQQIIIKKVYSTPNGPIINKISVAGKGEPSESYRYFAAVPQFVRRFLIFSPKQLG